MSCCVDCFLLGFAGSGLVFIWVEIFCDYLGRKINYLLKDNSQLPSSFKSILTFPS